MRRLRLQMSELEQVAAGQRTDPATSGSSLRAGTWPGPCQPQSADQLGASMSSLGSAGSPYGCNGDGLHREEEQSRRESTFCPSCGNVYMSDSNFCRKCGQRREEPGASQPLASSNDSAGVSRAGVADSLRAGAPRVLAAPARPQSVALARSEDPMSTSDYAGWEYRPHASDPIDESVANLVNCPGGRYRGWRALLCRLERGVYLCGTRRVHIRADDVAEHIEASEDGGVTWSDLADLMNGAEASQHALLERAKGAVGLVT